jgi:hypothetical protein
MIGHQISMISLVLLFHSLTSFHISTSISMFTLFNDPFYHRPTYWFQPQYYRRQPSLFERYLDALDQRFFSILRDDAVELLGLENRESSQKKSGSDSPPTASISDSTKSSSPSPDSQPQASEPTAPAPAASTEAQKSDATSAKQSVPQPTISSRQFISHTRSTFNGRDYVEEHREKVTGADGETRIATRRRLGDRWYENEVHVDKDGKRTERETWHNVGEEDIERFKLDWNDKQSGKAKFDQPAVTNEANANVNANAAAPNSPPASDESH